MKVFFTFLFIVSSAYSSAIHEYAPAVIKEARVTTGVSSQSRAQDNLGNYKFAYKEDHSEGGSFRKEEGNALGQVIGSYGLRTNDGRVRIVNYVADDLHGFRASIATNEPGTAAQSPSSTIISSPNAVVAAPVVSTPVVSTPVVSADIHHAPNTVHAAEPLVASAPAHSAVALENNVPIAHASHPTIVEAPATLIKSYASSIYGPSLITDNILFGPVKTAAVVPHISHEATSYVPPLNSPVNYVPAALKTSDGLGYYEPTQVYAHPSAIGYSLGTNVGQFGYELVYRKKKK